LANTIELLRLEGFTYQIVGRHYGRNPIKKIIGFIIRVMQLYKFLKDRAPDVSISHSSFYSPVVSRVLGIKSVYINDNEYAGGNIISFRFADIIMVPEFVETKKVVSQGAKMTKLCKYPGVKEGIYLWHIEQGEIKKKYDNLNNYKKIIYIRPEPWSAQYYKGEINFLDKLILALRDRYTVIILPRGTEQIHYYKQPKFSGIIVSEKSVRLLDIMKNCDLFIGAGGTMTREAAVLGVPTISVYQDKLLDVDKYLIRNGFMLHRKHLEVEDIQKILSLNRKAVSNTHLLQDGKKAYELIKETLIKDY
jgi:predicted glycosyltransferase